MKKATWTDIEAALQKGNLEDQDLETLEAFARVEALPSTNERYHLRYSQAQERIRFRIRELKEEKNQNAHWWKKPSGIVALTIISGIILILIAAFLGILSPEIFN